MTTRPPPHMPIVAALHRRPAVVEHGGDRRCQDHALHRRPRSHAGPHHVQSASDVGFSNVLLMEKNNKKNLIKKMQHAGNIYMQSWC